MTVQDGVWHDAEYQGEPVSCFALGPVRAVVRVLTGDWIVDSPHLSRSRGTAFHTAFAQGEALAEVYRHAKAEEVPAQ